MEIPGAGIMILNTQYTIKYTICNLVVCFVLCLRFCSWCFLYMLGRWVRGSVGRRIAGPRQNLSLVAFYDILVDNSGTILSSYHDIHAGF